MHLKVVHLSSALFELPSDGNSGQQSSSALGALMDDLALVKLLGVRLVLVVSVRRQVDQRLADLGLEVEYVGDWQVTSAKALQVVKEMSGAARATVCVLGVKLIIILIIMTMMTALVNMNNVYYKKACSSSYLCLSHLSSRDIVVGVHARWKLG